MFKIENVSDFIKKSSRCVIFHEQNVQDETEEVYYLLLPKENLSDEVIPALRHLTLLSFPHLEKLSKSSRYKILSQDGQLFHIHLSVMKKASPEDVENIRLEFKKNMPEVLLTVYPDLEVRIKAEEANEKKSQWVNNETNKSNSFSETKDGQKQEDSEGLLDFVINNSDDIFNNVAKDTKLKFANAKEFFQKKADELKPEMKAGVDELRESLPEVKENIQNVSKSVIGAVTKQISIFKKLK